MGGSDADRKQTVLLIDDDADVRRFVRQRLEAEGFEVVEAASGEAGLELLSESVSAVLLDVGLPGLDGFSVLRAIRGHYTMPVLMMTAAGDEADRVLGFEIGADDYIIKPFLPRELIARVRAVLRRSEPPTARARPLVFGDLHIDPLAREARNEGVILPLTQKEFDLLLFLATSPRQTFSREQLLRHVWGAEPGWQNVATVTEHVHRLRRHVESVPDQPNRIVTIRGVGYRFDP
jgi:two-component system, OmpR family, phosphate regulon response regulator PhoB